MPRRRGDGRGYPRGGVLRGDAREAREARGEDGRGGVPRVLLAGVAGPLATARESREDAVRRSSDGSMMCLF